MSLIGAIDNGLTPIIDGHREYLGDVRRDVQTVIDMARKLGISTAIPAYPSIHIGAASVYPIEMVAAYSVFSTLGMQARRTRWA